ncbi:uncharacterized protein LOC110451937 [Mizuhopecten yessoensis]|uniref:Uncharacterized protein n=1 Tax=Mizuhopecten yessoensis TaxID=6573 RepID=A0A210QL02_MIZYE|nr:uncharacterized protein LOC110451937 [Mizuhopecten yessoensis]OWF49341.1 hypothetical protein KP79_PYT14690 [Mizuhopecten yessoensis]
MDAFIKCLLFLSMLSITSALLQNDIGVHCTFPPSWQSKVFFESGEVLMSIPEVMNGTGTYYYDYPSQQMRFDLKLQASLGNVRLSNTYIWHFNESTVYTIDYDNHTCTKEKDSDYIWNPWNGVPLDAHSDWHGGVGDFQQITEHFTLIRKELYADVILTLDVNVGNVCPPIRYNIQDEDTDRASGLIVNYEFVDPQDLSDRSVFILPSFCANAKSSQHNPMGRRALSPRFHRLFMG